uniref:Transposase Tnp1/En/Spm-like domain-containing protein n=1 Tax=Oryza glumipatula TaxID=40148 RepID=A0A0E0AHT7_9ORYZ
MERAEELRLKQEQREITWFSCVGKIADRGDQRYQILFWCYRSKMAGREGNEKSAKVQYEIDRDNHIKNNVALLKKMNLLKMVPKNMLEIAEPGSSQPMGMTDNANDQPELNPDEEMEVQADPDYIAENDEEIDDYDDVDDDAAENNTVAQETGTNLFLDGLLGRPASRAEVYVVTHTKRDGQALNKEYEEKIKSKQIAGIGLLAGAKTVSLAMATDAVRKMGEENAEVKARMEEISSEYKSYKAYAEERFARNDQRFAELKELLLMSLQGSAAGAEKQLEATHISQEHRSSSSSENRMQINETNRHTAGKGPQKQGQDASVPRGQKVQLSSSKNMSQIAESVWKLPQKKRQFDKELDSGSCTQQKDEAGQNAQVMKLAQKKQGEDVRDIALLSLTENKIVVHGRLRCKDKSAKYADGLPLGDFFEVLVDVLDNNILLPRVHGQISKLGAAVVQTNGSALNISKRARGTFACPSFSLVHW